MCRCGPYQQQQRWTRVCTINFLSICFVSGFRFLFLFCFFFFVFFFFFTQKKPFVQAVYLPKSQPCALKIIALEEDETFDDLKVEIALLKVCHHPKIVEYIGSWQKGAELFIAMELCDGASIDRLQEALQRGLTEPELMTVTRDSLQGLEYLHKQHTLHRDIKSANLLVNTRGECKLVDFGVSVISEPGQKRMTFIGSPYWMAPEVIDNRTLPSPYGPKCDVWSLGVSLLEMADNCVPLSELQPMVALRQIPSRDPPSLRDESQWSKEFIDFLGKCLQKDPDDRLDTTQLQKMTWLTYKPVGPRPLVELVKAYLITTTGSAPDVPDIPAAAPVPVTAASLAAPANTPVKMPTVRSAAAQAPVSPRGTPEDPKMLAQEVEQRTDIDDTEKQIILSTLRDAQKKNRPTSLRRSIREQDKFVAQVRNAEALKEQLKQAKKAQQKQEAATKGLQNAQLKQHEALQRSQNVALEKARKVDAVAIKNQLDKSTAELNQLRKNEASAAKNLDKVLGVEQADYKKRALGHRTQLVKVVKENQAKRTKTTFANQKKEQLKDKATKKQVTALHKEQDKEWQMLEDANATRLSNLLQAQQVETDLCLNDFHARRMKDHQAGWQHLVHLREVQLVQRRGLQQLEALLRDQSIELDYHKQLQAMELEHLKSLHALRVEQTISGNQTELGNHKESAELEFKRLLRVHRNDAKNALKEWSKNSKSTMKKVNSTEKNQVKQRTAVEEEKMRAQQRMEEEKYTAGVRAQMEKDEKALTEYQKDSEARLKEFQLREMGKLRKEAEKKTEDIIEQHTNARAVLRKRVTVDALVLVFTHAKMELELMKQTQSENLIRQTNIRNERNTSRMQCGLPAAASDDAWQQQLIDKHIRMQEELLIEQKGQFHEVYQNSDDLAETIWSWRNSDDLQNKLDEVVPQAPGPHESSVDVAKEHADLVLRQDAYRDAQESRISKLDDSIKQQQMGTLDELMGSGKREAEELIAKIDAEEDERLQGFANAAANVK
jgi:serine/threonine protein kinase